MACTHCGLALRASGLASDYTDITGLCASCALGVVGIAAARAGADEAREADLAARPKLRSASLWEDLEPMPNTSERQLDYMEKSDLYDEFVAARSKSPRARAKLTPARSKFPQGSVDQKQRPVLKSSLRNSCAGII